MLFHSDKLSTILMKVRTSKGYSQTYMAQQLRISQKAYSYLESGNTRLELRKFIEIAQLTGTHPMQIIEKIIEGNPSWDSNDKREKELINENEKLKAEINYLKSVISFNQITILKKLEQVLETQESIIPFNSYK